MRHARRTAVLTVTLATAAALLAAPTGAGATSVARVETLRGTWEVRGPGVPEGTTAYFRGDAGGTVAVSLPCGEVTAGGGGTWERTAEGVFVADVAPVKECVGRGGRLAWLRGAGRLVADRGSWSLRGEDGTFPVMLHRATERTGHRSGPVLAPAADLPDGVRPAGPRAFAGRWFAVDQDGRRVQDRPVARVRADQSYRAASPCGPAAWRWALDRRTGALATTSNAYGASGCAGPDDREARLRLKLSARFAKAARAGRDGRFLVLTDRQGDVIGRYVRG